MLKDLTVELRRILTDGLALTDATMHYIDSTFDAPDAQELMGILADENDCERDPLIELLFSPDETTQVRVENLLQESTFNKEDQALITDELMKSQTVVKIGLPENRGQLELPLPAAGAERLVSLLHIEKRLPGKLRKAIDTNVKRSAATRIKVIFRNARCRFCERDVAFLSRALKGLDLDRPPDVDSLEYALTVLADSPSPADVYQVLMQRKKIYSRQLQAALKQEEQLRKSNPEIMMLQGKRIGGIDAAEARHLIAMIDRISIGAFGVTEPTLPPALEAEYDIQDRGETMKFFS